LPISTEFEYSLECHSLQSPIHLVSWNFHGIKFNVGQINGY
jgi:hypothetical protein